MKEVDLLVEIQKERVHYQETHDSNKLDEVISSLFEIATPLDMSDFLTEEDGNLLGKTLTFAIISLFKNKNTKSIEVFFQAFEEHKFKNKKEVNWSLVFNSLDKNLFSQYQSNHNANFQEEKSNKNSIQVQYVEKFGNINTLFKEEEVNLIGNMIINNESDVYEDIMNIKYGGMYYEHLQKNPEKLNYLLTKKIPFSQIKNMFFEAMRKEDTRTIGRLLHSQYAYNLVKDSDVHNFFILENPEQDALMYLKKEVLILVKELQNSYEMMMIQQSKEENFKKFKKI